jgi:hypothetical protein
VRYGQTIQNKPKQEIRNMKKKLLIGLVALAAAVAFKSSAVTVTVDQVAGYYLADGEFNVSGVLGSGYTAAALYNNNSSALGFGTFCIDRGVGIVIPGTYTATVYANEIDPFSGAPLTQGAAWLYSQFATGGNFNGVTSYNYTPGTGRVNAAYALQLAIWVLQGQYDISSIVPGSNGFINAAINKFTTLANAELAASYGQYGVGVLGLQNTQTGAQVQPMLALLPDGGATVMLLGMALSGLALVSRKIRAGQA